jgi:hypothetical protein
MSLNFKGWEATPELAKKIAEEFLGNWRFKGFQIVYTVHTDTDDIHVQFAINSVNHETGLRWHSTRDYPSKLIEFSNEICSRYGLSTVKLKNHEKDNRKEYLKESSRSPDSSRTVDTKASRNRRTRHLSSGEYRAAQNGRSWKREALLAGMDVKKIAHSREEFIELMGRVGYDVVWKESRKDITFITPYVRKDGKRNKINSDKLGFPERNYTPLTKAALEKQFALNRQVKQNDNKIILKHQDQIGQLINLAHKITAESANEYPFQNALMKSGGKEGQALKDFITELDKGKGLGWERD